MSRMSCALALLMAAFVPCQAQQTGAKPETLIRLSVVPAGAPKPALKYLLLPSLQEMSPGNPIEGYLKCYLEQYRFVFDEEQFDRRKTLLAMPLDLVARAGCWRVRPLCPGPQLDAAARLEKPDWQVLLKLRAEGFATPIPDVQAMRTLGRALEVRFRAEVAGGRVGRRDCGPRRRCSRWRGIWVSTPP